MTEAHANEIDLAALTNDTRLWNEELRTCIDSAIIERTITEIYRDNSSQEVAFSRGIGFREGEFIDDWVNFFDYPTWVDHEDEDKRIERTVIIKAVHLQTVINGKTETIVIHVNVTPFQLIELVDECWKTNGGPDLEINGSLNFNNELLHRAIQTTGMNRVLTEEQMDEICNDLKLDRRINPRTKRNLNQWKKS